MGTPSHDSLMTTYTFDKLSTSIFISILDINECTSNTDSCQSDISTCQNNAGSYTCNCNAGYQKNTGTNLCEG